MFHSGKSPFTDISAAKDGCHFECMVPENRICLRGERCIKIRKAACHECVFQRVTSLQFSQFHLVNCIHIFNVNRKWVTEKLYVLFMEMKIFKSTLELLLQLFQ